MQIVIERQWASNWIGNNCVTELIYKICLKIFHQTQQRPHHGSHEFQSIKRAKKIIFEETVAQRKQLAPTKMQGIIKLSFI